MQLETFTYNTITEAWFFLMYQLLERARRKNYIYTIDRGSYAGQRRLEWDFVAFHILYPNTRPLVPLMPPGIPAPVDNEYIEKYLDYILTDYMPENTVYTYGQRLNNWNNVNQIETVIKMFRDINPGYRTNQACMEIACPSDINLNDPPCLRLIQCRIQDNKLHFIMYFRSWDLWGGMPCNLPGLQLLKEYMSDAIGVEDGSMFCVSPGLHLYDYCWETAKLVARMPEGFKLLGE